MLCGSQIGIQGEGYIIIRLMDTQIYFIDPKGKFSYIQPEWMMKYSYVCIVKQDKVWDNMCSAAWLYKWKNGSLREYKLGMVYL